MHFFIHNYFLGEKDLSPLDITCPYEMGESFLWTFLLSDLYNYTF